ncbi:hypothetical protein [Nocardia brevicatena]|uniref:hypothetical protein n=1 Tax=Nocardia brevicatena TaxID=37327 RepID=UPI0002D7745B|nr:hypothetical protein [Nocardia brevicatena]
MSRYLDEQALARMAEQYIALWNEPDAQARRKRIRELWAVDSAQVLVNAPQGMREALTSLAVPIPSVEVRGHDALERRVTAAYELFVAPGEHRFAPDGPAVRLTDNLVGLAWLMGAVDDGSVVGGGYDVVVLDAEGRIRWDHQYVGIS